LFADCAGPDVIVDFFARHNTVAPQFRPCVRQWLVTQRPLDQAVRAVAGDERALADVQRDLDANCSRKPRTTGTTGATTGGTGDASGAS
jgi:hypothetical protein